MGSQSVGGIGFNREMHRLYRNEWVEDIEGENQNNGESCWVEESKWRVEAEERVREVRERIGYHDDDCSKLWKGNIKKSTIWIIRNS